MEKKKSINIYDKRYDSHHTQRNLKIDEWKEMISENNIYYRYDSEMNEVKLHRDRSNGECLLVKTKLQFY